MTRPTTTLFMLTSADGKISTGAGDALDFDTDLPKITGVSGGLHQYYDIEQTTDLWAFNTGRVQSKMGVNEKPLPDKSPVSFVLLDDHHLTEHGVRYFCARSQQFVLITSNPEHPAYRVNADNLHILFGRTLPETFAILRTDFGCERLTLQSGGTVNNLLLRQKLIDYVDLVVAPVLVGGRDTPTLIDGPSLTSTDELSALGVLQLDECTVLEGSYLRLRYRVMS